MKISERVQQGIKIRLQCEIPYLSKWHQVIKWVVEFFTNKAMALGIYPTNFLTTAQKLMKISDDIWYIAGDRSTDVNCLANRYLKWQYNWYSKRGLLLGAYLRTGKKLRFIVNIKNYFYFLTTVKTSRNLGNFWTDRFKIF